MRFACLYMPDFMLQANLRSEAGALDEAIALIDGAHPQVVAATHRALEAGVALGMTKTQIEQLAGIRHRSVVRENSAHAALLDCAKFSSPRVEDTAPDTVVADLGGLDKVLGPPPTIAARLLKQAEELELRIHLAIASNPDAAIVAARGFRGTTIIASREEAKKLGELPVSVLQPQPETLDVLERWGIHRLKELADLPPLALSERLGQEGVRLQELARGKHFRALIVVHEADKFEESWELETPAVTLDELDFVLASVLNRISKRLAARSLATQEMKLRLELVEGVEPEPSLALEEQRRETKTRRQETRDQRQAMPPNSSLDSRLSPLVYESRLSFPLPINDARLFFKLWWLRLEADVPRAPVAKITITAQPARPRPIQGGLFEPLAPDPDKLELTLARIRAQVGDRNVGSPEILDTHRPHAFRMAEFNPSGTGQSPRKHQPAHSRPATAPHLPRLALRLFRPPVRIGVELSSGRPLHVSSPKFCGKVVAAAGPWRQSGGWWEDEKWEREEWDVELRRGKTTALYSVYYDLARNEWCLEGEYD